MVTVFVVRQDHTKVLQYYVCFWLYSLYAVNADSRLYSHRPQLKAIKRVAFRRPKKTRKSDIYRRNVNHNKCLEQHPDNLAMPDFEIVKPESKLLCFFYFLLVS